MRLLLVCLSVSVCPAQNGSQFKDWKTPAGDPRDSPKIACADLRSLTGFEMTISRAMVVAAAADAPEHCRVEGHIQPEIRFEVSLPAAWNKRLYMFGNGGFAGEALTAPGRSTYRAKALRSGFAVAQTNTGHDASAEPLATFAQNRQKLLDYALRAVHVTAEAAKKIAEAYYGGRPARSYFDGCSTGGRQGLISAQRFPGDFDGIVVGAPVLNFTGTMMGYVQTARALAESPIPERKLKLLADRVYAQCDAKDGLADGLIDDPRKCGFAPARDLPKCEGDADGDSCFTAKQVEALEKIYADVTSQGQRIFPGWPVGAEVAGPRGSGWIPWLVRDKGETISVGFAQTFFRYMAFPEKDPAYELSRFDFAKDPQRLTEIHDILDATDTDLSRFRSRGGKILMYYGWADPALNARMGTEYYSSVSEQMGASTPDFFRLFMAPGMFHCSGGVGPFSFDPMTPLVQWVEKGQKPERILGAQMAAPDKVIRTRPLCPYPQVAKYQGTGDMNDAGNFICRE